MPRISDFEPKDAKRDIILNLTGALAVPDNAVSVRDEIMPLGEFLAILAEEMAGAGFSNSADLSRPTFRAVVAIRFSTKDRLAAREDIAAHVMRPIVCAITSLTASRTISIQDMVEPIGVFETSTSQALNVRAVTDYLVDSDALVTRIDLSLVIQ